MSMNDEVAWLSSFKFHILRSPFSNQNINFVTLTPLLYLFISSIAIYQCMLIACSGFCFGSNKCIVEEFSYFTSSFVYSMICLMFFVVHCIQCSIQYLHRFRCLFHYLKIQHILLSSNRPPLVSSTSELWGRLTQLGLSEENTHSFALFTFISFRIEENTQILNQFCHSFCVKSEENLHSFLPLDIQNWPSEIEIL